MLTADQKAFWNENGFLILPGFFSARETDAINAEVDRAWEEQPANLVVDDLVTGRRSYIRKVRGVDAAAHRFKVNDLYLDAGAVRNLSLDQRVVGILTDLLGDAPVLCNTLNLEQGSEQDDHIDSLYMTPITPGKLVATWVALEDSHADAGPLRYYPGSHRLPLYRFSNGGHSAISSELPEWLTYIHERIAAQGLQPRKFLARRGDLFIWHANLVHGGGEIRSKARTRKSLVNHYWALDDCRTQDMDTAPHGEGYWFRRPPQPVDSSRLKTMLRPVVRELRRRLSGGGKGATH